MKSILTKKNRDQRLPFLGAGDAPRGGLAAVDTQTEVGRSNEATQVVDGPKGSTARETARVAEHDSGSVRKADGCVDTVDAKTSATVQGGSWQLVTHKHWKLENDCNDRTGVVIWGVKRDTPAFHVCECLTKPAGPLNLEEVKTCKWRGNANHEHITLTMASSLARNARMETIKLACAKLGWKAIKSRTYITREAQRSCGSQNNALKPLTNGRSLPFTALAHQTPTGSTESEHKEESCLSSAPGKHRKPRKDKRRARIKLGQLNVQGGLSDKIAELEQIYTITGTILWRCLKPG